ncbi:hypothetical protein QOT17_016654 [Balamuthia mandrillaris]
MNRLLQLKGKKVHGGKALVLSFEDVDDLDKLSSDSSDTETEGSEWEDPSWVKDDRNLHLSRNSKGKNKLPSSSASSSSSSLSTVSVLQPGDEDLESGDADGDSGRFGGESREEQETEETELPEVRSPQKAHRHRHCHLSSNSEGPSASPSSSQHELIASLAASLALPSPLRVTCNGELQRTTVMARLWDKLDDGTNDDDEGEADGNGPKNADEVVVVSGSEDRDGPSSSPRASTTATETTDDTSNTSNLPTDSEPSATAMGSLEKASIDEPAAPSKTGSLSSLSSSSGKVPVRNKNPLSRSSPVVPHARQTQQTNNNTNGSSQQHGPEEADEEQQQLQQALSSAKKLKRVLRRRLSKLENEMPKRPPSTSYEETPMTTKQPDESSDTEKREGEPVVPLPLAAKDLKKGKKKVIRVSPRRRRPSLNSFQPPTAPATASSRSSTSPSSSTIATKPAPPFASEPNTPRDNTYQHHPPPHHHHYHPILERSSSKRLIRSASFAWGTVPAEERSKRFVELSALQSGPVATEHSSTSSPASSSASFEMAREQKKQKKKKIGRRRSGLLSGSLKEMKKYLHMSVSSDTFHSTDEQQQREETDQSDLESDYSEGFGTESEVSEGEEAMLRENSDKPRRRRRSISLSRRKKGKSSKKNSPRSSMEQQRQQPSDVAAVAEKKEQPNVRADDKENSLNSSSKTSLSSSSSGSNTTRNKKKGLQQAQQPQLRVSKGNSNTKQPTRRTARRSNTFAIPASSLHAEMNDWEL